jgi:hypothetical protein
MTSYPQLWMAQEHYWDLRREAELERLIRQAGPTQTAAWHGRALAWLGGRLIAWGSGLQMRYSTPATR